MKLRQFNGLVGNADGMWDGCGETASAKEILMRRQTQAADGKKKHPHVNKDALCLDSFQKRCLQFLSTLINTLSPR